MQIESVILNLEKILFNLKKFDESLIFVVDVHIDTIKK